MTNGSTTVFRNTFAGLEQHTLDDLRTVAKRCTYPPNTMLIKEGDRGEILYVIVKGKVAIVRKTEEGGEQLVAMRGPNEFFGEMSLLDNSPRMASCITLTDTVVLEVTEEAFERIVEESPAVAYAVLQRILATSRKIDKEAIQALQEKNEALEKAYAELKAAQAELVKKELLERELALAATVQLGLLPSSLPQHHDYAYAAILQPARQVGGDFYDVLELDETHVGLLMADVADKGFHAALFMAMTITLFVQASKLSLSPSEVMLAVHRGMLELSTTNDLFVTAFYAVLDRPTGRFAYVRAGHDRPLHFRPGQGVESLTGSGRFLGMLEELALEEYTCQLRPGDRLLLFSDGVPDATNEVGEQFGNRRLNDAFQSAGHLPAAELVQRITSEVDEWCGAAPQFDDQTLLVVEVVAEG